MRAGLRAIQQTLTPEAAGVLNDSIAEAGRRNHGQTTPLHVAATLLASPSGFLRQACIRSHPNSSHPLQCRALELCFSVALDRLATAQTQIQSPSEPPVSNALMAALKRAQAIQRRGCPDQQQQPLLAVKVELDQLIISILDDPSVSRVMREASFSSPAVKAKIEQAVTKSTSHGNPKHQLTMPIFLNPSPAFQLVNAREEEVKRALEIMLRLKKRNPILVGDGEPQAVVKDLLKRIESKELGSLMNVKVVSMEKGMLLSNKDQITEKMKELGGIIEGTIGNGGIILDLGDLKWLVEQPMVLEMHRVVIMEMSKLLARFRGEEGDEGSKLWFIGTATCETYLRCQVYHSTMETDWDLQAVPVATKSPFPRIFPGFGTEMRWRGPGEPMNPTRTISTPLQQPLFARHISDMQDSCQRATFCPQCSENYKREVSAIEKSLSEATQPSLPAWLQNANLNNNQSQGKENGVLSEHKTQELRKKWRDTCLHLHPNYYQTSHCDRSSPPMLSTTGLYNPNLLPHLIFPPKFPAVKPLGQALQLNTGQTTCQQTRISNSPPGSPVRTDLVLGRKETESTPEKGMGDQAKDFLGCISPGTTDKLCDKFSDASEVDTYKKLVKGLTEKVWWQEEAASTVASAITTCKLGNGKRQGSGSRGDIWLLFMGPDRVGKKKMALVLAEQICGVSPVVMSLGTHWCTDEMNTNSRGKTAIDRIVEAVQRNPFSVIMLEDIDETDSLVRRNIKNAIERGRLADSNGREVSLGNAIFILTGDWSTIHPEALGDSQFVDEAKVASIASSNCRLGLTVHEKSSKRSANWLPDDDRPLKPRKELRSTLSLDLRLSAADANDEDNVDGSHNSSDVTIDHEDEPNNPVNQQFSITSVAHELINNVDESVVFKPVNLAFALGKIKKAISLKFSTIMDDNLSLEVEDNVLEMILGGVWHDRTSLDEWIGNVLEPSFHQLKGQLRSGERMSSVVRLVVVVPESGSRSKSKCKGDWLPSSILV